MIPLSEHVDDWNHVGWKDPYFAHFYSERQGSYARSFELDRVYTPQMVIDGVREVVGSNTAAADKAFAKGHRDSKASCAPVFELGEAHKSWKHISRRKHSSPPGVRDVDVHIAIALDRAESQVSSGENAAHRLEHVAVMRDLKRIGSLKLTQAFSQDVQLDWRSAPGKARFIVFVQEHQSGKVAGAAQLPVERK